MVSGSNRRGTAPPSPPGSPTQRPIAQPSRHPNRPFTPVFRQPRRYTVVPTPLPPRHSHPRPPYSNSSYDPYSPSYGAIFRLEEDLEIEAQERRQRQARSPSPSSFIGTRRPEIGSSSYGSYSGLDSFSGHNTAGSSGSNRNLTRPSSLPKTSPTNPIDPRSTRSSANRRQTQSASLPASFSDRGSKHLQAQSSLSTSPYAAPNASSAEPRSKTKPIPVPPRGVSLDMGRYESYQLERWRRRDREQRIQRSMVPPPRPSEPASSSSSDSDF